MTITVVPDGVIVTQTEIVTLPNSDGDYSLEGETQNEARASAIQIRFPGTITTGDNSSPSAGTNSNGNHHLKGGSIAGIAIGGFVFLVLLVALVVLTLHRRKPGTAPTDIVMRPFVDATHAQLGTDEMGYNGQSPSEGRGENGQRRT